MSKPITRKLQLVKGVVTKEMNFYSIELALADAGTPIARKKVYEALSGLVEAGVLVRVRQGVYAPGENL